MSRATSYPDAGKLRATKPLPARALKAAQIERMNAAASLAHERETVAVVERLADDLDLRQDGRGVIYGPDGITPILRPVIRDYTKTISEGDDDQVRLYAEDILKRAARMRRDGMSSLAIRRALDIEQIVPDGEVFDRALDLGDQLLARDIVAGIEPAESRVVVGYEAVNPDGTVIEDDDGEP